MRKTPLTPAAALLLAAGLALPIGLALASEQGTGAAPAAPAAETADDVARAPAGGPPQVGDRLGTSAGEIAASLEAAGHRLREIEREGGRFEVEIGRGSGRGHEIYVDAATGLVTKVERDD